MDIKEKVKGFPDSCGVYLIKNKKGVVLYVGKASSLRKRLMTYFQKPPTAKMQSLLGRLKGIDYIQTRSSAQALLLENSLIKRYRPFYNAALKDDKSYPFVKIVQDDYPYLVIARGRKEREARYFGPYTNVKLLKKAIKTIRAVFPFRSCRRLPKKPCLYLDLKLCPGMCVSRVDKLRYRENLRQLELFLKGKHKLLLKRLNQKMREAAGSRLYEQAAILRDRIGSLSEIIAQGRQAGPENILLELQKLLRLPKLPYRIEAFDISEIAGFGLSGAMVSFLGGWPDKKNYRRFRIKTVTGIDDYAMIREVLRRRYALERRKQNRPLPDLVMIDGGKGHLSSAGEELKGLGLEQMPVIALAKRLETIYGFGGQVINLPGHSKMLHLLQRIRDEAHRFAISYHRKLRQNRMRESALDNIAGIGAKRKKMLMQHFKSLQAIRKAGLDELLQVEGIDRKTAENVLHFFSKKGF
jgi:excinuclease ABC subunit C